MTSDEYERDERLEKFRASCGKEFVKKIDRSRLINPAAFDRVALWDGSFPGPCAFGETGTSKTRAAWSALCNLWVNHQKSFAWFPVRKLIGELDGEDLTNESRGFLLGIKYCSMFFVDDIDKINWQFESEKSALFTFYDWIYRENKPCITTTNQSKQWWAGNMGEAFARRLFVDAHFAVRF